MKKVLFVAAIAAFCAASCSEGKASESRTDDGTRLAKVHELPNEQEWKDGAVMPSSVRRVSKMFVKGEIIQEGQRFFEIDSIAAN